MRKSTPYQGCRFTLDILCDKFTNGVERWLFFAYQGAKSNATVMEINKLKNTLQINNRKKPLIWSSFERVRRLISTVFYYHIKGESGTPDIDFQGVGKMQNTAKFDILQTNPSERPIFSDLSTGYGGIKKKSSEVEKIPQRGEVYTMPLSKLIRGLVVSVGIVAVGQKWRPLHNEL